MSQIHISEDEALIIKNLHDGVLAPVRSLLSAKEIQQCLITGFYAGELVSIPYLVFSDTECTGTLELFFDGEKVCEIVGHTESLDLDAYCLSVFGTTDTRHPGVAYVLKNQGRYIVTGRIQAFSWAPEIPYTDLVCGPGCVFQSRNPPHAAHEAIVKQHSPALVYTTPYATTKASDYLFALKIQAYEYMASMYGSKLYVSTLPRLFAGKKEALQNCLMFQNMGFNAFLMGRGKNCVGDFYDEDEPFQYCNALYEAGLLKIRPVYQDKVEVKGINVSASAIKAQYIDQGIQPPEALMNPSISKLLLGEAIQCN